jgi:hypothetical protein
MRPHHLRVRRFLGDFQFALKINFLASATRGQHSSNSCSRYMSSDVFIALLFSIKQEENVISIYSRPGLSEWQQHLQELRQITGVVT